mgnify:CR=1 FL=1
MAFNKLVVRYADGSIAKGTTADFFPERQIFHLERPDAKPGSLAEAVHLQRCKALFFVKDFQGDPRHQDSKTFGFIRPLHGSKIKVVFKDTEVLLGTTHGYDPSRPGFFVYPADPDSNIRQCFVVSAATQDVHLL